MSVHNQEVWIIAAICFMLMTLGFFNTEIAAMMNGPAWLLLGLTSLRWLR